MTLGTCTISPSSTGWMWVSSMTDISSLRPATANFRELRAWSRSRAGSGTLTTRRRRAAGCGRRSRGALAIVRRSAGVMAAALPRPRACRAVTAGAEWTVGRAERYLRTLPAAARTFALTVIDAEGGVADADELRELLGSLRGATIALSRAMPRGVKAGWWPEGTPAPIQPTYDPDNPSWQRAISYVLDREYLPVFREAASCFRPAPAQPWTQKQAEQAASPRWAGDAPSAFTPAGWGTDEVPLVVLGGPDGDDEPSGWADAEVPLVILDGLDGDDK